MNVAKFGRGKVPMVMSQLNIRPVFDVHADVQGRDLDTRGRRDRQGHRSRSARIRRTAITVDAQRARSRRCGRASTACSGGMALAVVLVFLLHGDQFPELARSADRAAGGAVRAGGRDVDAFRDADAYQRAGADGNADVHRADDRQQHSGRHLCQSAHGRRRRSRARPPSRPATRGCARC